MYLSISVDGMSTCRSSVSWNSCLRLKRVLNGLSSLFLSRPITARETRFSCCCLIACISCMVDDAIDATTDSTVGATEAASSGGMIMVIGIVGNDAVY